jgi:putative transposase
LYRVTLSDEQRRQLKERTRQAGIAPSIRDRLEMIRLSDAGWSIPKIAKHLDQHTQTVRYWIKAFLEGGFDALINKPRGGTQKSALTEAMLDAVHARVAKGDRTWTAGQIAQWVALEFGVCLSDERMRVHLKRRGLSYKRTGRSLRHKQQPEQVASKRADIETLEKGGQPV